MPTLRAGNHRFHRPADDEQVTTTKKESRHMTSPTTASTSTTKKSSDTAESTSTGAVVETALVTSRGKTSIADSVVEKIAGLAAREINGVHKLGGGAARAFGAIREKIPGPSESLAQGVSVEVGERQAAVDLDITVEYGAEIGELSKAIRRNVISAIERMTTLEVTEVNIVVHDVYVPSDDDDDDHQDARVA